MNRVISIFILGIFCISSFPAYCQINGMPHLATDPDNALFIYTDIQTFMKAHQMLVPGCDSAAVLQSEYLDKGTPGLKMFIEKYDLTAEKIVKAIQKHPDEYASLEKIPGILKKNKPVYSASFAKLKKVVPNAVFPPTYFLIEAYRGIGSGSAEGQLISVEKWAGIDGDLDDHIVGERTMVIHELVHFQQVMAVGYDKYVALFGPEKNLLGLCIREGTAEFFADLVTGTITQDEALDYTIAHEKELWDWFQKEMDGNETGDWMWKKPEDPDQPMHVGYVLGSRIVETYYNQAEDKSQAVQDILGVTDFQAFLEQSKYGQRFDRK